jgi:hypothetical protein
MLRELNPKQSSDPWENKVKLSRLNSLMRSSKDDTNR